MREEHDNRIAELYRQSSQETPPAHLDQAVMDTARKSVRRRGYSPFGNHWIAGGAMVGVIMLSVLLLLDVPQQPDFHVPLEEAVVPSATRNEAARTETLSSKLPAAAEKKREAPAAPKARFDFYELLPEMEVVVPDAEEPASLASRIPSMTFYLQAGLFRDETRADALQLKLTGLGFRCEIRKVSIDDMDVLYRVRVGPFADPEVRDQSRQKLDELGIETQTVTERK